MPLKTYTGPTLGALLERISTDLGADAEVVRTDTRHVPGGRREYVVVAGDPESIRQARLAARPEPAAARRPAVPAAEAEAPARGPLPSSPEPEPLERRRTAGPDVLAFVGPTGAGKTTIVAKLAAHPRIFGERTVGILGLDTYKVGALDQLAGHAALGDRPFEVAYDAQDLQAARARLQRCDVILVDCPGRGPRAQRDADQVRTMLATLRPVETHVVLPSGLKTEALRRAAETFRARGATHLLATKVDEHPDDWGVFDLAAELGMPMRWLGDGQAIPQDIRSAKARLDAAMGSRRRGVSPARLVEVA